MTDSTLLTNPMLEDYPVGSKPGWTHGDDGHHTFVNPKFGQLEVGVVPGKSWDQWLFHENAGGGSLVIGYTVMGTDVSPDYPGLLRQTPYVMMLKANRFNLNGDRDDWELTGGFVDDGETKLNAAIREIFEETDQLAHPVPVPGRGFVGNRAFFELNGEDEGTSVFMFELSKEQIKVIERSETLQLMDWRHAARETRDALTGMSIARFVAEMELSGALI